MSEYIRREDAINALEEKEHEPWYLHKDLEWISGVVEAKDEIKAIEPADVVKVVHGRWVKEYRAKGQVANMCTECGGETGRVSNFCPNCGAKMDREE